jgi:glucose/arabinose dehydrogenase
LQRQEQKVSLFFKIRTESVWVFAFYVLVLAGGKVWGAGGATYLSASNVPMAVGYATSVVIEGLEHPWGMAWLPDGRMLITERPGRLRVVTAGVLQPEPIKGLPAVFASGQAGLLDVTIDPDFSDNHRVYISYAHGDAIANRLRVARGVFSDGELKELVVICETSQAKRGNQHFGSRFLWLPDKTLLVSVGDGGNPPIRLGGDWIRKQAQNRASRLGKILRITPNGEAPTDNPFVGEKAVDALIWSYGHRNIQGLTRDPKSGRIWASEHGALGGDELNLIRKGSNYGWPLVTHSREYFGLSISDEKSRPGMIDPALVWRVAIAPSGLALYSGDRFLEWRGNLFAGGLIAQDVRRIVVTRDGRVANEEAIRIGARVRDVRQGPDGFLYVLTDEASGRLIRIHPADGSPDRAP